MSTAGHIWVKKMAVLSCSFEQQVFILYSKPTIYVLKSRGAIVDSVHIDGRS